jgi:hypothetical protein
MNPHLSLDRIHDKLNADLAEDRQRRTEEELGHQAQPNMDMPARLENPGLETIKAEAIKEIDLGVSATVEYNGSEYISQPQSSQTISELHTGKYITEKVYAEPRKSQQNSLATDPLSDVYRTVNIRDIVAPDQGRFYDRDYQSILEIMVERVIETEGPVFKDLVIARIREAHGFQRARDQIREIITRAIGNRFKTTQEFDGRVVLWPQLLTPKATVPWRGLGERTHVEVPICELASLAIVYEKDGIDDEGIVRAMQEHLQLGRLHGSTRDRFEEAVKQMRSRGDS